MACCGRMPGNVLSYENGSDFFQAAICACHSARPASGGSTTLFNSARAYLMSLTIGNVGFFVLVDFRRIDVDVYDLAVLGEFRHLARHAIVESHAEGQQQVGLVHGVVGIHAAVHAQHVERLARRRPGYEPRPIRVMVTGIWVLRASSRSSSLAPLAMMPPPA